MTTKTHEETKPTDVAKAPTTVERLAAARAAKAERDRTAAVASEARELELLELDAKYAEELGRKGVDYDVFAVLGEPIAVKRWHVLEKSAYDERALKESKGAKPDLNGDFNLVLPVVLHPSPARFRELVFGAGGKPGADGFVYRSIQRVLRLHGQLDVEEVGKP